MINMLFLSDIQEKKWIFKENDTHQIPFNIHIGFRNKNQLPVIFNGLSFGFSIFDKNNEKIHEYSFEETEDNKIFSTDQEYIYAEQIDNLFFGKEYNIKLWSQNNGEKWEKNFVFTIMQEQPYPSWILNKETNIWEPPIPYPTGEQMMSWNEENKNWEK